MSGHSKWASIKHKKAIVDAKKGKLFTKLARAVTVAAREGGGDIDGNPALALAVQKARDASMPKDNIERAIAKGTGAGTDADAIETVVYEGYGPGGVAVLVEALTDNRNRTASDIRSAFSKFGGNLGETNSVSFMFQRKGVILYPLSAAGADAMFEAGLEAGAEDVATGPEGHELTCAAEDFSAVREALEAKFGPAQEARLAWRPLNSVPVDADTADTLLRLLDMLEDNDDVQTVSANYEIADEVLARLTA